MRCFLGCFAASKPNKRSSLANCPPINHLRDVTTATLPLVTTAQPIEKKLEEQLSCNGETKIASFDLSDKNDNVMSLGDAAPDVVVLGKNEGKRGQHRIICTSNLIPKEESEDLEVKNDGTFNSKFLVEEELSESLFSLSIDSRKQTYRIEVGEKEVVSPMPKCVSFSQGLESMGSYADSVETPQTRSVDCVLTPVENRPRLKAVKATPTLKLHNLYKENIHLMQDTTDNCSFELLWKKERANSDQKKVLGNDIAVNASLSSWLIEPETTPLSKGSANSATNSVYGSPAGSLQSTEGRIILGAFQVSGSVTPRLQKSRGSDDSLNLGTVRSYWRHTGQMVDSDSGSSGKESVKKYAADERENWNSTPFDARLDSALLKTVSSV